MEGIPDTAESTTQPSAPDLNPEPGIKNDQKPEPKQTLIDKQYHNNGTVAIEIVQLDDDKEHTILRRYYDTGKLYEEINLKNGIKYGTHKIWHKNGKPKAEYNYKGRDPEYSFRDWVMKDGVQKEWHASGTLKIEHNYKDNHQHGTQKEWYENGQLESERNYVDGKEDGIQKGWFGDGKAKYIHTYSNGKRVSNVRDSGMLKTDDLVTASCIIC